MPFGNPLQSGGAGFYRGRIVDDEHVEMRIRLSSDPHETVRKPSPAVMRDEDRQDPRELGRLGFLGARYLSFGDGHSRGEVKGCGSSGR
jgi:hypothetical protein